MKKGPYVTLLIYIKVFLLQILKLFRLYNDLFYGKKLLGRLKEYFKGVKFQSKGFHEDLDFVLYVCSVISVEQD